MSSQEPASAAPRRPCPICGRPAARTWRPFCSKRCADVDLARWLGEHYVIAGEPDEIPLESPEGERKRG